LINDINFKVSLTSINILIKLLVVDLVDLKNQHILIDTVVKKLSDGKVVIRQALLKASSLIIKNNNPDDFLGIAINHLNDESWHVREGVVYLIANCKIV
jgi:hypothetical protein